jgi:alkylhydroperoxidase/carboxymuconolactone decarboxylase family protein YurZ
MRANTNAERIARLKQKYDATAIDNGMRLRPDDFLDEVEWRGILDDRTRLLMMVGICLALNEPVQMENHFRGAILLGATPREVLEVILQSTAYCGMPTTVQTVRVLDRVETAKTRSSERTAPG